MVTVRLLPDNRSDSNNTQDLFNGDEIMVSETQSKTSIIWRVQSSVEKFLDHRRRNWEDFVVDGDPIFENTPHGKKAPTNDMFDKMFSLSLETREMIYAEIFENIPSTLTVRYDLSKDTSLRHRPPIPGLPALCFVNHQLFEETVAVLFRNKEIIIGSVPDMFSLSWLLNLVRGRRAYRGISKLHLESAINMDAPDASHMFALNFDPAKDPYVRAGYQFVECCTALQHLSLDIPFTELIRCCWSSAGIVPKLREQVRQEWVRVARTIAGLTRLQTLRVVCCGHRRYLTPVVPPHELFKHLVEVFQDLTVKKPIMLEVMYELNAPKKPYLG
ncbi:hypothetical protein BS50DRAFT_584073 [Corynespora cassiicola Philippines]|uniref:Uncharacterized protein n=1 Tax=Corynespora cassiicola Philippines TaxID=1448308 RepID=A0A2T2P4D5_CORCC|nr:hypothetical protein BS50DRAFT_584073 [Corynespora cassiicola Philippines]